MNRQKWDNAVAREGEGERRNANLQSLSYPTETVLSNKMTRDRIVLSSKDSPKKPQRRRPRDSECNYSRENWP